MPNPTVFNQNVQVVNERSTARYQATLEDHEGNSIPLAALATVRLTLYDVTTGQIMNGVDRLDVLNTDRGTVNANGVLTIILRRDDTSILNSTRRQERHRLLIEWSYGAGGIHIGRWEVDHFVRNLYLVEGRRLEAGSGVYTLTGSAVTVTKT